MSATIHSPIGTLVNIGSHRLHIHATGEGSPSVVFESGGASWWWMQFGKWLTSFVKGRLLHELTPGVKLAGCRVRCISE